MTTTELRNAFLKYFEGHDHRIVRSSPLVPGNDPTLLFTNAGMVQFKDVFLGDEKRDYVRATTSQRCVRAGGKHNDLENVGYTARHHTFFEMLGNFSFGDYFKRDAIRYAWEFVTNVLGIPEERLWVTVYQDDDEAADIWLNEIGVPATRFSRLGERDNFWSMGDTGPCGPCSEIFYDHGPDVAGGPPGSPDEDGDRYIEIWNLVFMQFDRAADGEMTPLPKPSVDTGMGLERVAAVMQGVHSNYEIDLFARLIDTTAKVLGVNNDGHASLRVIADHIRACSFLIVDGVLPGREGRGYVLRRIIRRAIRHGRKLGADDTFFAKLVGPLCEVMGDAYPELVEAREHVVRVLDKEERRFDETLKDGLSLLESAITDLDGSVIPGDVAFRLYDTYGFPVDLTADIARERGLTVDEVGFQSAMDAQKKKAQAASKFGKATQGGINVDAESAFLGYDDDEATGAVVALLNGDAPTERLNEGEQGAVVLDRTPFYGESGGQVGDTGFLLAPGVRFCVEDTQKSGDALVHIGKVIEGQLDVGTSVKAEIDTRRRALIRRHHTATHLLHAALREVLGTHVTQKGSLVNDEKLRFDFSHYEPVSADELATIERRVNEEIMANHDAETRLMDLDAAVESGAMSLFGEKYDSKVRVLSLGEFSVELCGGTHVGRTGDIGLFKVITETGIASGVRRIEAVAGEAALAWINAGDRTLARIAAHVKGSRQDAAEKVEQLIGKTRGLEKELATAKRRIAEGGGNERDPLESAINLGDVRVLTLRMDETDPGTLRDTVDRFKSRLGRGVVVIGGVEDGKVRLAAGVTKDLTTTIRAGDLIKAVAEVVGGRGGGRPDFAQAGGSDVDELPAALAAVQPWVESRLGNESSAS
ncbi:MAG: alanine--tRNA ligase [Pseudomonadota bacterium]